jgi:predicted RNA-binding protein
MCESRVYVTGSDSPFMEDVVRIIIQGDKVKMWDILGKYAEIKGRIVEMDLIGHKIILEGLDEG